MAGSSDLYAVLGVERTASRDEIQKAYKKLARQHHPDLNPGDAQAEERFKEISEAYAVLSDAEKRKQYDMFGAEGFGQRFSQEDIFRGFDFNDIFDIGISEGIFSRLFGGLGGKGGRGGGRTRVFRYGGPEGFRNMAPPVKGEDLQIEVPITLHEMAFGTEKPISF